jgi:hypothetical protein
MFRHISSWRLTALLMLLLFAANPPAKAQNNYGDGASYQQFYDELSPYGEWVDDPEYGYVWIPDAGDDFRPYYSNGYWANTDYGNTWVSNYDWGWAPFHYGRWTYNNYYGWVWIPGNEWGPAWVSWRSGGGAYGWAPLGPGISINLAFGNNYYAPDYWWIFTPQQYILNPRFHQYTYGPRYNTNYIRQTTIINNTYVYNNRTYVTGPRRTELERATGRPVQVVSIRDSRRPDRASVRGNNLNLYRPNIAESRPRATERPRSFRTSEQPIGAPSHELSTPANRRGEGQPGRDLVPDRVIRDQPRLDGQPQQPRIDRQQRDRATFPRVDRQQPRQMETQPEINRPDWNNNGRTPERRPIQQPQPRIDRSPRNMESPRMEQVRPMQQPRIERQRIEQPRPMVQPQRMESPRIQQARPMQQPRIERPQMEQPRSRVEPQRMESPRSMPQRQEPAAQPMRNDRQFGVDNSRLMRR